MKCRYGVNGLRLAEGMELLRLLVVGCPHNHFFLEQVCGRLFK